MNGTDTLTSPGVIIVLFDTSIFRTVSFTAHSNYPRGLPRGFNIDIHVCVRLRREKRRIREREREREGGRGKRERERERDGSEVHARMRGG